MKQLSPDQVGQALRLAELIHRGLRTRPLALQEVKRSGVGRHLKLAEARMRAVLRSRGRVPLSERTVATEFGLTLYRLWADFPDLAAALELPKTAISQGKFARAVAPAEAAIVADDGEIWGFGKYEQLDAAWALSLLNYLKTLIFGKSNFRHTPVNINATGKKQVTVALAGDWGTGAWDDHGCICPAVKVAQRIQALNPDYSIHLGDVYYSGTGDEEHENLLDLWPRASRGTFTMNANHEMYSGADGLFQVLEEEGGTFSAQHGTSYFSIELDDWIILGLDSAYYADNALCQDGVLSDDDSDQIAFIQTLPLMKKRVIILTHHNALSLDGTKAQGLWTDVVTKLRKAPDFWYWGHLHNGVVYSNKAASGVTRTRCVGHGALPYGKASVLLQGDRPIQTVEYFSRTPLKEPAPGQENRVQNGFALLTFSPKGLTEQFFNQNGQVEWSKQWASRTRLRGRKKAGAKRRRIRSKR